jgi:hypothetical protein
MTKRFAIDAPQRAHQMRQARTSGNPGAIHSDPNITG